MKKKTPSRLTHFRFSPGTILADKYEVISKLGSGWEGEVYRVSEIGLGVERAAKLFFPHRNRKNHATRFYARKLHKLRECPILIHYHNQELLDYRGHTVTCLISEFVEGELLSRFLKRQPGRKISVFEGLHLLHTLAAGVEMIHKAGEYHGDLHDENIIIRRKGIHFDFKLVDMFNWGKPSADNIRDDVCDLIRVFYDAIGGAKQYSRHRKEIKSICCGLKRSLIIKKYRTAGKLREYLENMVWDIPRR